MVYQAPYCIHYTSLGLLLLEYSHHLTGLDKPHNSEWTYHEGYHSAPFVYERSRGLQLRSPIDTGCVTGSHNGYEAYVLSLGTTFFVVRVLVLAEEALVEICCTEGQHIRTDLSPIRCGVGVSTLSKRHHQNIA